jgi:hypothetical protein
LTGIDEISRTRQRVAEEVAASKDDKNKEEMETDVPTSKVANMDVDADDAAGQNKPNESEKKEELPSLQADDDDAVEY